MLNDRQKDILKLIVLQYVKTARPVGSKSICQKLKCSSATIRNDMARLEELGFLEKTHISSGRIPSESGYRYYVDNLMEPKKISGEDMLKLQTIFSNNELELSYDINKSLEIISDITNYTSVVLGKASHENLLEIVEIIPVGEKCIVAIVVTNKGHVESKQISLPTAIDNAELVKATELVNKMLVGTPINKVGEKLEYEIKPIIGSYIKNYEVLYNAFYEAFRDFAENKNVRFSGKANMLKQPEFTTVDDVKKIISKFESEEVVSKIEETDDEVKIYIGKDNELDDDLTVIKTKYDTGSEEGTIAIIGPKRMEYDRVITMLNYVKDNIEKKGDSDGK